MTASSFYDHSAPTTPPAKDLPELQVRTFAKLRRHHITPLVDPGVRLAHCAGSRESDPASEERLKNDLLQILLATDPLGPGGPSGKEKESSTSERTEGLGVAGDGDDGDGDDDDHPAPPDLGARFLSVTVTSAEPVSVLLEHRLLERRGGALLGAKAAADALVPITLDLRDLPLEATGIVCGVAGRLAARQERGSRGGTPPERSERSERSEGPAGPDVSEDDHRDDDDHDDDPVEIAFLSTVRAGTVIVRASQLARALEALEVGMRRVDDPDAGGEAGADAGAGP